MKRKINFLENEFKSLILWTGWKSDVSRLTHFIFHIIGFYSQEDRFLLPSSKKDLEIWFREFRKFRENFGILS